MQSQKYFYAYFNYIGEIKMHINDVNACSHAGSCNHDVRIAMQLPYIKKQLDSIDPAHLIEELSEYGAWDQIQLSVHSDNLGRIVWIAAGNIADEIYENKKK